MQLSRRSYIVAAGLLLLVVGPHVLAGSQEHAESSVPIPRIIALGLTAYRAEGADAAMKAWVKGGPLEGGKDALDQAAALRSIQEVYGVYRRHELLRTQEISPSVRIYFFTIEYERGPLFLRFVLYHYNPTQEWIVTGLDFDTRPERILPEVALPPQAPAASTNPASPS